MSIGWQGVFPAVTTRFDADLAIDHAAMERHVARQVAAGCDGIIVAGSLGEGSTLTSDERLALAATARRACDRPVIMTLAESRTDRAVELARAAEAQGVDGLMVLPPMLYHASPAEVVTWFRTIAGGCGLPLMLYVNPVAYKIDVTPPMLMELARHERIVAVKESSDDVRRVTAIRRQLGDRLLIFTGVDNLALESAATGADGWVAGLVNAFPDETAAVWRLAKAGRLEEANAIYRWFAPLLELDVSPRLVQNIKLAEAMVGVGDERVRPPRLPLQGAEREHAQMVIEAALKQRPTLPD